MNAVFRKLYHCGAWLASPDALEVSALGIMTLRAQNRLAEISLALREPRFPLHVKPHMLFHTFKFLKQWGEKHPWVENPLVDACQIDESFVGVISRYSRRVSPKTTVSRTYDLYLTSLRRHLMDDDRGE